MNRNFDLQQKLLYFEMAKWKLSSFFKTSSCKDSYCKYLSMQQSEFLNDILLAGKTKNWLKDWQKRKLLWAYQPPKSLLLLKENLTALNGLTSETKLGQVKYLLNVLFFQGVRCFCQFFKRNITNQYHEHEIWISRS